MAGLNLGAHAALYGGATSNGGSSRDSVSSVNEAAFGPGTSSPAPSVGSILKPNDGLGIAFWTGIVAIGLLVIVRKSLPN